MSAISSEMLAAMREAISDLLPDTCDILSVTRTADGKGGWTDSWGTASAGVACRMDSTQGMEQMVGGGLKAYQSYMLSLPYDTTITTAYRVLFNGTSYNVTSVNTDQSWIAVKRVTLEKT